MAQLDQIKVPEKEKTQVMTIVGSLKPYIVQSGSPNNITKRKHGGCH